MTGRATEIALDALHGLLAGALKSELEAALAGAQPGEDGTPGEPINPQLFDKVMKFLGQNGIDTPQAAPRIDALASVLMDIDLDAELASRPHRH